MDKSVKKKLIVGIAVVLVGVGVSYISFRKQINEFFKTKVYGR